jgi:hypothetical protein
MNTIIKNLSPQKRAWITRKMRYGNSGVKPCDVMPQKRAWDTRRARYQNGTAVELVNVGEIETKNKTSKLTKMFYRILEDRVEVCGAEGNVVVMGWDDMTCMYEFARMKGYVK